MTLFTRQIRSMMMRLMASQGLLGPLATVDATIGAKDRMITAPSKTCKEVDFSALGHLPECPGSRSKQLMLATFSRMVSPCQKVTISGCLS